MDNPDGEQTLWLMEFFSGLISQPFTFEILVAFLIILLLLTASALISGSEVAFFSLSAKEIQELRSSNDRAPSLILALLDKPRYLLATILIANNFINVAIIIISSYVVVSLFNFSENPLAGFIIEVIAVTFILVLFGEVIPKIYATQKNLRLARLMAFPLLILKRMFHPVSYLLVSSTKVIDKKIHGLQSQFASLEEIDHAIEIATDHKTSSQEISILKGIVKFGNITAKQIMRARVDLVAADHESSYKELLELVKESGYSRIPVYKETLDNIVGVLYAKDLLAHLHEDEHFGWQELIRKPFFVPASKKISDLLQEIQTNRTHMTIVVDEYGGTLGLVTLEDIMEEIIGEIKDEFDDLEELEYQKLDDKNFIFEGKTSLNDAAKVMNIRSSVFDNIKGESDTLAGLILENSGKIPDQGEKIKLNGFLFTILSVTKKRITKAKITLIEEDFNEPEED